MSQTHCLWLSGERGRERRSRERDEVFFLSLRFFFFLEGVCLRLSRGGGREEGRSHGGLFLGGVSLEGGVSPGFLVLSGFLLVVVARAREGGKREGGGEVFFLGGGLLGVRCFS